MDSLVGYGSDDEVEDRYGQQTVGGAGMRRREDDTNYDSVNMDMSEESQAESEPELPPADAGPPPHHDTHQTNDGGDSDRSRDRDGDRARDGDRPRNRDGDRQRDRDRDWRRDASRRDDRPYRSDRSERRSHDGPRRGLLGDRPGDRPARLDTKYGEAARSHDARDAVSPRFVDRERGDRRERDRERDRSRDRDSDRARDRDGDRHRERDRDSRSRHSEDRRSGRVGRSERSRSRSRGAAFPPPPASDRHSPGGDYRPSYKVNRKLEVMEKMGLQIKTPDGSMATARELRAAAGAGAAPQAAVGAQGRRRRGRQVVRHQVRAGLRRPPGLQVHATHGHQGPRGAGECGVGGWGGRGGGRRGGGGGGPHQEAGGAVPGDAGAVRRGARHHAHHARRRPRLHAQPLLIKIPLKALISKLKNYRFDPSPHAWCGPVELVTLYINKITNLICLLPAVLSCTKPLSVVPFRLLEYLWFRLFCIIVI